MLFGDHYGAAVDIELRRRSQIEPVFSPTLAKVRDIELLLYLAGTCIWNV